MDTRVKGSAELLAPSSISADRLRQWATDTVGALVQVSESAVGTEEPIDVTRGWSACWGAADDLGSKGRRRPKPTVN